MNEVVKQLKTKRRWLRFSLRTFLIAVTLLGVVVGPYIYRAEKQRAAVKWVREYGGRVCYDYELDLNGESIDDSLPSVPKWLLDTLGVDYFCTVGLVEVHRGRTAFKNCIPLSYLKDLEFLDLSDTQVSDVTPLAGLTSLERLTLSRTQVSDVTPLAGLTNLEHLNLSETQVSDVTPLAGLTNFERLFLDNTQVSDLTPLAGLTNLYFLILSHTQVSDLTPLAGLTSLVVLDLSHTQVSDEDIEKLKQAMPNCRVQR